MQGIFKAKEAGSKQWVNFLISLYKLMTEQEQRGMVRGKKLLRATKTGNFGEPWKPLSWKDMVH